MNSTTRLAQFSSPILVVAALLAGRPADGASTAPGGTPERALDAPAAQALVASLPAGFDANEGQFDEAVRLVSHAGGATAWFLDGETRVVLGADDAGPGAPSPRPYAPTASHGVVRLSYGGAATPRGEALLPGTSSYFLGDDPSRWRGGVASFARTRYRGAAPGVDLVWHGTRRALEYDLVVAPGANPSAFSMHVAGVSSMRIDDATGDLVMRTAEGGVLRHSKPRCRQVVDGATTAPAARFVVDGADVRFEVASYDRAAELVIDPSLDVSSYYGASTGSDVANAVATGTTGDIYLCGTTGSYTFPVASAFQSTHSGFFGTDAFVVRIKSDATQALFSTYFGGGNSDNGTGIAVDANGSPVVCGYTSSTNFPTSAAAQTSNGGGSHDGFVARLVSAGNSLTFSTYLGGSGDDYVWGVSLDTSGSAYVAGETGSSNLPVSNARQSTSGGGSYDGLVGKYTSTGALSYLTYHGGSGNDGTYAIFADASGAAYVGGYTTSTTGFPTANAYQSGAGGGQDGWIAKYNTQGRALVFGTYIGGSGLDVVNAIAVDPSGGAIVCGSTASTDFSVVGGAQKTFGGGANDAFVARLQTSGAQLAFSTYLGGTASDIAYAIQADKSDGFLVAGVTNSGNFPVASAIQSSFAGGNYDAFMTRYASGSATPAYSTYFGGTAEDQCYGASLDVNGRFVIAGITYSTNLTTKNALQGSNTGGGGDAMIVRITPTPPSAPTNLTATLQGLLTAHVAWTDTSTNETGFAVERKIGTGAFTTFVTLSSGVVSYDDITLASNTTYTYRVRAVGAEGSSAYTNEASVATGNAGVAPPVPKTPDGLTAIVVTPTEVDLTWNDQSNDETRFEVQRKSGGAPTVSAGSSGQDVASFVDDQVTPGWPVTYRVRALAVQGPSALSNPATATTPGTVVLATTKGVVTDSASVKKDKVTWTASLAPVDTTVVLDPVASGVRLQCGPADGPVAVTVAPNDATWKFSAKTKKYTWKSAKGASVKAAITVDAAKNTITVSLSAFDFSTPATTSVRMLVALGDVAGGLDATWIAGKHSTFAAPKP